MLLMCGCAVTFTAAAGAYLAIRENYTKASKRSPVAAPVKRGSAERDQPRALRRTRAA